MKTAFFILILAFVTTSLEASAAKQRRKANSEVSRSIAKKHQVEKREPVSPLILGVGY
jgi:hypothetical protein